MWLICPKSSAKLRSSPETLIEIAGKPDDMCVPCPSLKERVMRNRDYAVIEKLNVVAGDEISWAEVEKRIRSSVSPEDLERICQDCRWLPQG